MDLLYRLKILFGNRTTLLWQASKNVALTKAAVPPEREPFAASLGGMGFFVPSSGSILTHLWVLTSILLIVQSVNALLSTILADSYWVNSDPLPTVPESKNK